MVPKDCSKFGKTEPNSLPRAVVAPRIGGTQRVRFTIDHALDSQTGLLGDINLGDQKQEGATAGTGGPHRRRGSLSHRGLNPSGTLSGTLQEGRAEIPRRSTTGNLGGYRRQGLRHEQGGSQPIRAGSRRGRKGTLDVVLSGRPNHDLNLRDRVASYLRGIHYYHRKRQVATTALGILRASLRDEIIHAQRVARGQSGPAQQAQRADNHRAYFNTNEGPSMANSGTGNTSQQPGYIPSSRLQQLVAIRLAYVYYCHRQLGSGIGHLGPRVFVPISLASSDPFSDWPTYNNMSFVQNNYSQNQSGLIADARRGAILLGRQMATMPGYQGRPMPEHHRN
ncbi:hypothetical protein BJV82DRAFT_623682 [Fennellomyces sp. T-0311]|nr:hypothetical protein BJV82DRAFT_623682 [Fennellomyces sp. T-0311]